MFDALKFRFAWRAYQARVLDHLNLYQEDRKIHIVAPPGAGKTVLGLEIVRQLNEQTLILAPSLTIRAQWAQRLQQDFMTEEQEVVKLISHELLQPGAITIVTYQALHYYLKENDPASLDWLKVLVVDECHHLRREWWRSLNGLMEVITPNLVALTATPPFDVSGLEWRRYHEFCGEIDEEISIPELVAASDLCYHQDYVYPVLPEEEVLAESRSFADRKAELYATLSELRFLAAHIQAHPWLREPELHYEAIFAEPAYFTALLSVLQYLGSEPPVTALGVLHGELTVAPELNEEWLQLFLEKALRNDPYFQEGEPAEILRPIRRIVRTMGAWDAGRLLLTEPPAMRTKQARSRAKLKAVSEIAAHEWEALGEKLRMVVLTDYIYPELMPTTPYDRTELTRLGVSSLFEQLRRDGLDDGARALYLHDCTATNRLAILTGTLVVIPQDAFVSLEQLAVKSLGSTHGLKSQPLFPGSAYVLIQSSTQAQKRLVSWITTLFTQGQINIIIGTTALLGEGWDAPAINSLVLASAVGSFVLSNQMRGRAIRRHASVPHKTANIWHPVTLNPELPGGGSDVQQLARRFRAFAGPNWQGEAVIMNGLRRYGIDFTKASPSQVQHLAERMLLSSRDRSELAGRWQAALAGGRQLVEAIEPPSARYYRREDRLSQYYFERADREQRLELRIFKLRWRAAFIGCWVATAALLALVSFPLWTVLLFVPITGLLTYLLHRGISKLRQTRRRIELPEDESSLPDYRYYLYPVLGALPLLTLSWVGPLVFLGLLALTVYVSMPMVESDISVARYELLSSSRARLERYGRALLQSLLALGKLHHAKLEHLVIEEDQKARQLAYLADADHHDNHLFAESMSELMRPVDNPRWLLRLREPPEWFQGAYYLPVPEQLAKRREGAELLADALSTELELEFEPIFTRTPIGRQHLLAAKLQLAKLAGSRQAQREVLWR